VSEVWIDRCDVSPSIGHDADAAIAVYRTVNNLAAKRRSLLTYVTDPKTSMDQGSIDTLRVPFEPLPVVEGEEGLCGGLFAVDLSGAPKGVRPGAIDLDDGDQRANEGYLPDAADARFHGQMVYGVAMATYDTFRLALGRVIGWRPLPGGHSFAPLTLRPFAALDRNAWYDRSQHEIAFGYFGADQNTGLPSGRYVFSSLSSDIIVHETAHALLDALKPNFMRPSNPEALAFHEGFADLMAVFHRFSFRRYVRSVIERDRFQFDAKGLTGALAAEFASAMGRGDALRNLADAMPAGQDVHTLGKKLADAVFLAFSLIAMKKAAPLIRMATGRLRLDADSPVPPLLLDQLANILSRLAPKFRGICIRALDYCPPVDINFGDFLRAMITADTEVVLDDSWGYREAMVQGFRQQDIYPHEMTTLSEYALRWNGPYREGGYRIEAFALQNLNFNGDPGLPSSRAHIREHALILAAEIENNPALASEIGLHAVVPEEYDPPEVVSVRPTRRSGPDGQIAFDLVAEVIQRRYVPLGGDRRFLVLGGATIIFSADGQVRFIIRKRSSNDLWRDNHLAALQSGYAMRDLGGNRFDFDDRFTFDLCRK
jgi:hypothetical protein